MAVKKPVKRQSTKKPLVKQVLPKKKRKAVKKDVETLPQRRLLDKALTIDTQIDGSTVSIFVGTTSEVAVLDVAVNGRSVWKGQP